MIVDGKAIAEDITQSLRQKLCARGVRPTLSIISVAPNFATAKYLGIKVRVAEYIGITIDKTELPIETTTDEVIEILKSKTADGVVLQLPIASTSTFSGNASSTRPISICSG